jgi:hypothetical protein
MSNPTDYQQDLASIRHLMERSAKFLSLSGLSGALAGLYALAASAYAYGALYEGGQLRGFETYELAATVDSLLYLAVVVLTLSVCTGLWFSYRKAKRTNMPFWSETAKRLVVNLAVPVITGGIFILMLLLQGYYALVVPVCLLFYGLALINASGHLYDEVRYLGYTEIMLGLVAAWLAPFGLFFWAFGFGVLHIIYGTVMYFRYDRS